MKWFSINDKVWVIAIILGLCLMCAAPFARSGEVGLVQTTGTPTCQDAKRDMIAVSARLQHLRDEFEAETDPRIREVMKVESKAVLVLGRTILMWSNENCRNS